MPSLPQVFVLPCSTLKPPSYSYPRTVVGFSAVLRRVAYFDMQGGRVVLIAVAGLWFCGCLCTSMSMERVGPGGYSISILIFLAVACSVPNVL